MKTKKDLSIIYDNWYAYGFGHPTEDQKNNFWLDVFNTEDEGFIKSKILDCDLDKILVQYIQHVSAQRNLNFRAVMEIFSLWWTDVLSEHKQKCAHVLHSLLSDKDLPTGTEEQNEKRLKDMIQSEQWDNAVIHHKPFEYPSHAQHSWDILKNLFKGQYYTDETWNNTLYQLDKYMGSGGVCETEDEKYGKKHMLLMPLVKAIARNGDTQKMHDLFERGINVQTIRCNHEVKGTEQMICEMYDEYFNQVLTNEVLDETKTKTQRKI